MRSVGRDHSRVVLHEFSLPDHISGYHRVVLIVETHRTGFSSSSRRFRFSIVGLSHPQRIKGEHVLERMDYLFDMKWDLSRDWRNNQDAPPGISMERMDSLFLIAESSPDEDASSAAWEAFRKIAVMKSMDELSELVPETMNDIKKYNERIRWAAEVAASTAESDVPRSLYEFAVESGNAPLVKRLGGMNPKTMMAAAMSVSVESVPTIARACPHIGMGKMQNRCFSSRNVDVITEFASIPGADVVSAEDALYDLEYIDVEPMKRFLRNVPGASIRKAQEYAVKKNDANLLISIISFPGIDIEAAFSFFIQRHRDNGAAYLVKFLDDGLMDISTLFTKVMVHGKHDVILDLIKNFNRSHLEAKRDHDGLEAMVVASENRNFWEQFAKSFPDRPFIPGLLAVEKVMES